MSSTIHLYRTPLGVTCAVHKTVAMHDEPCWQCEAVVACPFCGYDGPHRSKSNGYCEVDEMCQKRFARTEGAAALAGALALASWVAARAESHRWEAFCAAWGHHHVVDENTGQTFCTRDHD